MLLNALGVAVYTTDATGAITFFNEAAVTFWGRRPEPGEAWTGAWRLFHAGGQSVAPEEDPIATALTEDRAISGAEGELERPDGSRGAFISYPAPLHNGSGEVIGAINVLVDVTERRKTEEALWTAAEAHRSHLEMRLDNLLSNADKYGPPESPSEVVVTSEGNEAMVTVLDRGIGIEDADESKLFTAFYRTEAAKTRTNGLGIGLAVCQRIVDSLGGRVWAQPREGGGTEAGFALPLAEATAD